MQEHQDSAQLLEVINAQLCKDFGQLLIERCLVLRETAKQLQSTLSDSQGQQVS